MQKIFNFLQYHPKMSNVKRDRIYIYIHNFISIKQHIEIYLDLVLLSVDIGF